MNRGFEKVSKEVFEKDQFGKYEDVIIPKRKTKYSAGYDFFLVDDIKIKQGEVLKVPTGIKSFMKEDEVLYIFIRSSLGTKKNINLANQVGVVDSDYYNNVDNEGNIYIVIKNIGNSEVSLKKGEAFAQGVFSKFLISDSEEKITAQRMGGFGSTNKDVI